MISYVLSLLLLCSIGSAFYLPGVAPNDYIVGDSIPVLVNSLTPSGDYDLKSLIAYDYYHPNFDFCQPEDGPKQVSESLGSILFGDRIFTAPYKLKLLENQECVLLCAKTYSPKPSRFINRRIREHYVMNMIVDGLPVARVHKNSATGEEFYSSGFALGEIHDGTPYLNNHLNFEIEYHVTKSGKYRIVGVSVYPASKQSTVDDLGNPDCSSTVLISLDSDSATEVVYTYSVSWKESATPWATRWDKYLEVEDSKIHWFSIVNSSAIVVFLLGMVGVVLLRTLHKDISHYNELDLDSGSQEETGWKLVYGDVFRPPSHPLLLSVMLGSGAQLLLMGTTVIVFALMGLLSPSNRGSLPTVMLLVFALYAFFSGYVSARAYQIFQGENWKLVVILAPTLVPSCVFSVFVMLNFFLISKGSSGAVPFGTMVLIVFIWFLISVPLSCAGSYCGLKAKAYEAPVRVNQIPRQIPTQPTYLLLVPSILCAGILPFGSIFVELYFILSSLWMHKYYYMFGFLFLCFGILIATCAAVSILFVYFLLCAENYNWQWRSFMFSGGTAIYILIHSLIFWVTRASGFNFASAVLYFGYSFILAGLVFLLTGFVGFSASFIFVDRIYRAIKID
ncbi:hypothetical protein CANCADRAFT_1952 [Tortispora caseinolytica NRRL Y-17796]|uniref:Transmembrane 9 superfamily member n=1 Tax=Tortispora caseinolytica NRRL Y-17796 TaxID=767744 RepID=A0A1E4TEM0_9ASCO|nr:hypothetical protein CANCADRAFT_1952 [Tortispora caseinolytica NRRL Y-17796]